jgi:exocyst complex component 3
VVAQSKEAAFFWTFVTLMGGYGCREYFEDVSNTRAKFEQTLWGHIRNFFQLAKESPQTLVRALRVVEMQQEILDQQQAEEAAEADGAGPMSNLPAPRASRK